MQGIFDCTRIFNSDFLTYLVLWHHLASDGQDEILQLARIPAQPFNEYNKLD